MANPSTTIPQALCPLMPNGAFPTVAQDLRSWRQMTTPHRPDLKRNWSETSRMVRRAPTGCPSRSTSTAGCVWRRRRTPTAPSQRGTCENKSTGRRLRKTGRLGRTSRADAGEHSSTAKLSSPALCCRSDFSPTHLSDQLNLEKVEQRANWIHICDARLADGKKQPYGCAVLVYHQRSAVAVSSKGTV